MRPKRRCGSALRRSVVRQKPRHRIGSGILVGAFVPIAGVVIIAGFLPAYYLPIRGEYGEDTATDRPG
ncbi:hypothetical protein [Micromonospora zamorensis]|uniref:hypothetical protein n=1 Tax=Micromonospora zamorensis TaxID=709883 RepID=UPI00379B4B72